MSNDQLLRLEALRMSAIQGQVNLTVAASIYKFLKGTKETSKKGGKK